jgi:hypothetical protein
MFDLDGLLLTGICNQQYDQLCMFKKSEEDDHTIQREALSQALPMKEMHF